MKKRCFKVFVCILLLSLSWYAGKLPRVYALDMDMNATPNPVGSGARAIGGGGAFIGIADDATAASWNPSGLLQLTKSEFSIVGSSFSGQIDFDTSAIMGADPYDETPTTQHLNYLSIVHPFTLLRRNFVFSLNYQHLYEFSKDTIYLWREIDEEAGLDITYKAHKCQKGSLTTISPAFAFQVTPSFFAGFTANFWPDNKLNNGWENLNCSTGEGISGGRLHESYAEIYERYDFSGFNMHAGFLFTTSYYSVGEENRRLRLGGVIKTPFSADIHHEVKKISYIQYPDNPVLTTYVKPSFPPEDLTLKMPLSYGFGICLDCSDSFSLALDLYRTHWEQYLMKYPSGRKISPINKKEKDEAGITPTIQVRLGFEYLFQNPKWIIPVRVGTFYDPEPAEGSPDDFYGMSAGSGITYNELFSLDFAYQYRFGQKKDAESMQGEYITGSVTQHYFYTSIIYYFL